MDLLTKFSAVEVKNDSRITDDDRIFCEKHQKAYELALTEFKELAYIWDDIVAGQRNAFEGIPQVSDYTYLDAADGVKIDDSRIQGNIEAVQKGFIRELVSYFTAKYKVTIDSDEVVSALLPKAPTHWSYSESERAAYRKQMYDAALRYETVVDQIIARLGGRSFTEQAVFELKSKCYQAAWNTYKGKRQFERKKDVLVFTGYFCSFSSWCEKWEPDDKLEDLLRGIAFFETGVIGRYPVEILELLRYKRSETDVIEFTGCTKIRRLKMYKNNRADLKFASAADAEEFVKDFLNETGAAAA